MNPLLPIISIIIIILLMISLILSHTLKPGGAKTFFSILTYISVILMVLLIAWLVFKVMSYEKVAKLAIASNVNPLYLKRAAMEK